MSFWRTYSNATTPTPSQCFVLKCFYDIVVFAKLLENTDENRKMCENKVQELYTGIVLFPYRYVSEMLTALKLDGASTLASSPRSGYSEKGVQMQTPDPEVTVSEAHKNV